MDGSTLRWALLELMADARMFGDYDMAAWLLTEAADWMWHYPHDEVIFDAYIRLWAAFAQPG